MKLECNFRMLKCQMCLKKLHCAQCRSELEESVRMIAGVSTAKVEADRAHMAVNFSADRDALIDALEELGLILNV